MTTLLLIRHAAHDLVGKALAGRKPGVLLNEQGERQAEALSRRLATDGIGAIYASPRERAQQTAAPLAAALRQDIRLCAALDDIDFGQWTGRTFQELESEPQWPVWCQRRTAARPPDGETITEVQQRTIQALAALAADHEGGTVALFSHCDVIKAALAHYLALSLNELERFEIAPASVSTVLLGDNWSKVKSINRELT